MCVCVCVYCTRLRLALFEGCKGEEEEQITQWESYSLLPQYRALACCFFFFSFFFFPGVILSYSGSPISSFSIYMSGGHYIEGHRNLLTLPTPPVTINLLLNSLSLSSLSLIRFFFFFYFLFSPSFSSFLKDTPMLLCFALPIPYHLVPACISTSDRYCIPLVASSSSLSSPSHNFNHVDWMTRREKKIK